jgi:hypothetical protein
MPEAVAEGLKEAGCEVDQRNIPVGGVVATPQNRPRRFAVEAWQVMHHIALCED